MWPAKSELSGRNEDQKHCKNSERKKDEMFRPCRHEIVGMKTYLGAKTQA